MNFTYTLIKPPDETWGAIQPDIGAPFIVTQQRSVVMTFASPITQIYHTLFIKNPAEKNNFLAYIEPMNWLT